MTLAALTEAAAAQGLSVLGAFHPTPEDGAPEECQTLVLLGPREPGFWPRFTQSPEWRDGVDDPMDRWSKRVVDDLAHDLGALPLYPFGGEPFLPFYSWALKTGRVHASPVQFLVHDTAGLMVSFRGALSLPWRLALPTNPPSPCETCADRPCRSVCPVAALTPSGYDVETCKAYLDTPGGTTCVTGGCAVRTSCPVSARSGRLPAQSEYHMRQFKGAPR